MEFGGYLPVSMNCIGNWCVEAGDLITISVQDNSISFPIFVRTMHWNGAVTDEYEATGQKDRAVYTSEKNKQKVLTNKEIKLYVDGNFYDVKSGIEIKEEGVEISGGKYVKIKSGGSFVVDSGNFEIDAEGNATFGGTLTSPTGSIGGFEIASSKLQTTNFEINSGFRYIRLTDWYLDDDGLYHEESDQTFGKKIIGFGKWSLNHDSPYPRLTIAGSIDKRSGSNITRQLLGISFREADGYTQRIILQNDVTYRKVKIYSVEYNEDNTTTNIKGTLGDDSTNGRWDVNGDIIKYNSLVQNSSKEIKHDIKPLPSVGEKLDKLKPVTFVYDDDKDEKQRTGMIYEDTVEIMPEICTDNEADKAINYVELIPMLLKEIQDLRARVKQLEER